jgi:selenocysteine lyase/cysteine desulfurase
MVYSEKVQAFSVDLRSEIAGVDQIVPLLDGRDVPYVNLDNAASTPALRTVLQKVEEALGWYSSIHRGSGFKSMLSTQLYEEAREITLDFVRADRERDCVIFCKNTTEALNKLAKCFPFGPGDMVLTTGMEHHSNDLPWRARAKVIHAALLPDGSLDLEDFRANLLKYAGQIKLVAITGASNVTGYMPPIYDIAELAHEHGAKIVVDCAQLLPHRQVDMGAHGSPRHLDFIAFSAHKIYAPLGSGGLVGPKEFFDQGEPDVRGGGTVEIVTLNEVTWTGAPEREEAGSPNVIGAIALASSLQFLSQIGMEHIARHEAELTYYALTRLGTVPGIRIFGSSDPEQVEKRVGVIPFALEGISHGKLAAILGFEGGIGVRNGCFCAHPYILHLLGVTHEEYLHYHDRVLQHNRADLPGLVRMSFACYNNLSDVDRLVDMLARITRGDIQGEYEADAASGTYYPLGFQPESIRGKYFAFQAQANRYQKN